MLEAMLLQVCKVWASKIKVSRALQANHIAEILMELDESRGTEGNTNLKELLHQEGLAKLV